MIPSTLMDGDLPEPSVQPTGGRRAAEIFLVFLRLGCTSFGGPIAHLGYFRREIVERRRWCNERAFGEIVGIAQSLPGPASSQVGFALGIVRGGWVGGIAAWLGFTLPSAVLMVAFAYGHGLLNDSADGRLLHGLQLVAVAVVAQAVVAMQRTLAPDRLRLGFAAVALAIMFSIAPQIATLTAICLGGVAGLVFLRSGEPGVDDDSVIPLSRTAGVVAASLFLFLLLLVPILVYVSGFYGLDVFSSFYRSGALVFGGGHVVLPLLENAVVARGWVTQQTFLAGYGAAQALPGPLFTFAAFLGASVRPSSNPVFYGLLGLVGIFAPGLLAMAAVLPFWSVLREREGVRAALRGVNASVVGVLMAALIRPLWTSTIHKPSDFVIALAAFMLLVILRWRPWVVVAGTVLASMAVGF